jgi:predicted component of type VI protein secretion system
VPSRVYLNDSATAAASIRAFNAVLERLDTRVSEADARRVAPDLGRHARALCVASGRLSNQVVEDVDVEAQRALVAEPLAELCVVMTAVAERAAEGRPRAMVPTIGQYRTIVGRIREAVDPPRSRDDQG